MEALVKVMEGKNTQEKGQRGEISQILEEEEEEEEEEKRKHRSALRALKNGIFRTSSNSKNNFT